MMTTVASRLLGAMPAWAADPAPDVVIRHRSGSISSRRAYPIAKNDPFIPRTIQKPGFALEGVGEGNDVYLEPEDDAEAGSDEAKNRVKRLRNIGGGSQVLKEQTEGDLDNELRSVKAKADTLVTVSQNDEEIEVGTAGATNFVNINIDGLIGTTEGVVHTLVEGLRGGTGTLSITRCGGSPTPILSWRNGHILTAGDVTFDVGDCSSTATPGS